MIHRSNYAGTFLTQKPFDVNKYLEIAQSSKASSTILKVLFKKKVFEIKHRIGL